MIDWWVFFSEEITVSNGYGHTKIIEQFSDTHLHMMLWLGSPVQFALTFRNA